jgi:hypothetical protein
MNKSLFCVLLLLVPGAQAQTPDPFQAAPAADLQWHAIRRWVATDASLAPARDRLPVAAPPAASRLALAIGRAAKKGIIELAVDDYTEILIQCQKSRSVVLTTPLLRSDAQQAHCYRF